MGERRYDFLDSSKHAMRTLTLLLTFFVSHSALAAPPVRITVQPGKVRQEFHGLGCGAKFYVGHIPSLAARQKDDR